MASLRIGGLPSDRWTCDDRTYEHVGLRLHYLDAVRLDAIRLDAARLDAGGPPVDRADALLMLHGLAGHADAWRSVIARLHEPARVIAPDFRGHGLSDWTVDGYWLADYARDIVALADQLGLERIDLLGHSLGGRVAMVLAPLLGDRLRSVILSDTGPEVSRSAAKQAQAINSSTKSETGFRDGERLRAHLREQQPTWVEEAIEVRAQRLYRLNYAGMLVHRGDPEVAWLLGKAGLREVDDMWAGLRSIQVPLMIFHATRSFLLDADLLDRMCAAAARPAVRTFDLGHFLPYEDPDTYASAVDEFVADPAGAVAVPAGGVAGDPTR